MIDTEAAQAMLSWAIPDAACLGQDEEDDEGRSIFFPSVKGDRSALRLARAVCGGCPVQEECLNHALTYDERDGVWGGLSPSERKRAARPVR